MRPIQPSAHQYKALRPNMLIAEPLRAVLGTPCEEYADGHSHDQETRDEQASVSPSASDSYSVTHALLVYAVENLGRGDPASYRRTQPRVAAAVAVMRILRVVGVPSAAVRTINPFPATMNAHRNLRKSFYKVPQYGDPENKDMPSWMAPIPGARPDSAASFRLEGRGC
jgi:hypothetical protein